MNVANCRPYHSKTVGRRLVRMPDGLSVFKTYFVSIVGRDDPRRYEWNHCPIKPDTFEEALRRTAPAGVGFVIAFPHIVKVFRFAPAMETVLHVRAFNTADFSLLGLSREDGYVEFACYAEAAIAADEYHAWARAKSVDEYLAAWSPFVDGPILRHDKLASYAAAGPRA